MAKRTQYEWTVTFSDGVVVHTTAARVDRATEKAIMLRFKEMGSMEYCRRRLKMTSWVKGPAVQ